MRCWRLWRPENCIMKEFRVENSDSFEGEKIK